MAGVAHAQAWLAREAQAAQMRRWVKAYPEAKATLNEIAQGRTCVAGERNLRLTSPVDREIRVIPRHKLAYFIKVVEEIEKDQNNQ